MNKLCLNLDIPDLSYERFMDILKETNKYVDFYKVNLAFVNDTKLIYKIVQQSAIYNIEVILDAKYGDIYNTNEEYAERVDQLNVEGVTLNPFAGLESLVPFAQGLFTPYILLTTTNAEQEEWQMKISDEIISFAKGYNCGIICPSNKIDYVKERHPNALILCPGIGYQGGSIEGMHDNIIYCVGRSVLKLDNIEAGIKAFKSEVDKTNIMRIMKQNDCLYIGKTTLSSGNETDIYFDFRKAFGKKGHLRTKIVQELRHVCRINNIQNIVGIAQGGIAAASVVADNLDLNFAYIRTNAKQHGTKSKIEGYINPHGKTLIFDDVVTTGKSIDNALKTLAENYCFTEYIDTFCILDRSKRQNYRSIFKYQCNG